jgi:hypothetical protein
VRTGAIDFGSLVSVISLNPSVILPDRSRHFLAADICLAFNVTGRALEVDALFFEARFLAGVFAILILPTVRLRVKFHWRCFETARISSQVVDSSEHYSLQE